MAPVTPPSLEDNSGPPAKTQCQPLESLTSAQIVQDYSEILLGIISEAVTCSEEGTHGPTGAVTSCVSATCSLGGVSPPQDLALALSNLVSSNSRYKRKTLFNCDIKSSDNPISLSFVFFCWEAKSRLLTAYLYVLSLRQFPCSSAQWVESLPEETL